MNFQRTNNLLGWLLFASALTVYVLTLEPTASFWDAGEFIASAHHLLVPHPPGAPLFLLLGRVFSLFSFGDTTLVAGLINGVSAVSSAFTVLFLFWTITLLARKLVQSKAPSTEPSFSEKMLILGQALWGRWPLPSPIHSGIMLPKPRYTPCPRFARPSWCGPC
ncbi:DUF2723 domain-containing protein [Hymenobacter qilianensis]|uniref:DUF2723 domain-containing protein n=1 Tax=Hymenobacter qilianensis TaxID=1385715 RepID=A0A7H0GX13_9BACT|nr:DUF2723 domain-containing protein [Hymenobacter qilianensis]QNP52829.1 DUF2723 domain-containing protein [Hymenobacter qilianensis]